MSFEKLFETYNWEEIKRKVYETTPSDVERSLAKTKRSVHDFIHLVSPAAEPYLERLAQESKRLTQQRFGKTVQMYIPMYLSNECQNICTYCGFSLDNKIPRRTLSELDIRMECEAIKKLGFDHILLVTGEANTTVGMPYFRKMIPVVQEYFAQVSIEVQPLDQIDYEELVALGMYAVLVYQETYHKADYKLHHPKGKKSNFSYRLDTPDRLGKAQVHKMGLGVLIGLEDWRTDSFFNALHLTYLQRTYWKTKYSVSFPRLRPNAGGLEPKVVMNDKELVQLICAYRLCFPDAELSLSTRESEHFRNNVIPLGITSMSAGSKTNPGGYEAAEESLEQFEIDDTRSPKEIEQLIASVGYEAVWKDWDSSLMTSK